MTRTPLLFPVPGRDHRTFLQPPLSLMTAPASGSPAIHPKNSSRSSFDQSFAASVTNVGVS